MSDIPGLPSTVDVKNEAELQRTLQAMLQAMNVWAGRKGISDEWLVSRKDLNDIAVLRQSGTKIYNPNLPTDAPLKTQPVVIDNVTANSILVTANGADVWIQF